MQETQDTKIQSLGREDPLEKETATHSSLLAWRIPWTEEPGGLQSTGSQRAGHDRAHIYTDGRQTSQAGYFCLQEAEESPEESVNKQVITKRHDKTQLGRASLGAS